MDLHEGNRIGGGSVKADGERGGAIVWETYLQVSNKHILHTTKNNRLTWKESVVRYWREAVGGWDWWWFGVKAGCDFNAIELSESNCEIRGRSTRFLRKSLIFGIEFVPEPTWRYEISKWARWLERFFKSWEMIFVNRGKIGKEAFQILRHEGTGCWCQIWHTNSCPTVVPLLL